MVTVKSLKLVQSYDTDRVPTAAVEVNPMIALTVLFLEFLPSLTRFIYKNVELMFLFQGLEV